MILFGDLLKDLRINAGISQKELANMVELSEGHLNRVERNKVNPLKMVNLKKIAICLGLSVKEINLLCTITILEKAGFNNEADTLREKYLKSIVVHERKKITKMSRTFKRILKVIKTIETDDKISARNKRKIIKDVYDFTEWLYKNAKNKISNGNHTNNSSIRT